MVNDIKVITRTPDLEYNIADNEENGENIRTTLEKELNRLHDEEGFDIIAAGCGPRGSGGADPVSGLRCTLILQKNANKLSR